MQKIRLNTALAVIGVLLCKVAADTADWTCPNQGGTYASSVYCTPTITPSVNETKVAVSYPGAYYYSAAGKGSGACTYIDSGNFTLTSGTVALSIGWNPANATYGSMFAYCWQTQVGGQAWLAKTGHCSDNSTCY